MASVAEESMFRGTLNFFNDIGIYDVVLPFLLTFTIVFAIMEKTKIFGMEKVGDKEYTKKNLNAMVAFVMAFFVVASSQLVSVINKVVGWVVLLLLLSILFLILIGSFHEEKKEGFFLEKGSWAYGTFMVIMFVGILLIFLYALGWLEIAYDYLTNNVTSNVVTSLVFIFLIVLFMWYVTKDRKPEKESKK